MAQVGKKTRGKQAIQIKRIENLDDRMTTFSKRKSGIYKKASELAILTGAEVAVVVFSPSGKPYTFAHPSIDAISKRFLKENPPQNDITHALVEAHRQLRIADRNQARNDILDQLDILKEHQKMLEEIIKGKATQGWWEVPTEKVSAEVLPQMDAVLEELINNLNFKLNEKYFGVGEASSSMFPEFYPLKPEF